ncbi:MAG TPA: flagellar hook-basal body protein [Solirubrobacterales bacterium]|nr:flagellar hook-basal body protein [Solirubrobacterales bacterium]
MLAGLYSAAAGMEAQQARMDAVSSDLANVSTTGYKSLRVGFRDLLYQPTGRGGAAGTQTGSGAAATMLGRDYAQGALMQTERPLDVALTGPGFIQVKAADGGVALTRDGNLGLTPDGRLRTSGGQLLEPPLRVPPGTDPSEVQIAADGEVRLGRRRLGRIEVVNVPNPDGLRPDGESLFRPTAASGPVGAARGARLEQGALESSNVDMADATVAMMNAQRGFELASRAIQMQDEVLAVANGVKR